MSYDLIPQSRAKYTDFAYKEHELVNIYKNPVRSFQSWDAFLLTTKHVFEVQPILNQLSLSYIARYKRCEPKME